MPPRSEREFAVEVVRTLRTAGHEALWAGGCVRDELLGLTPKDYDVATSRPARAGAEGCSAAPSPSAPASASSRCSARASTASTCASRWPRSAPTALYIDGRRPETVVFSSAREGRPAARLHHQRHVLRSARGSADRLRRRAGRPRGPRPPRHRRSAWSASTEDRLRMLRAVRLAARFEFTIDPATAAAIRRMAPQLADGVSAERIADELRKLLVDRHRGSRHAAVHGSGAGRGRHAGTDAHARLAAGLPGPTAPPCRRRDGPAGAAADGEPADDLWEHVLARAGPACPPPSRSRWPWPRCCTTSASRAPSAGRPIATPSTATSTSAGAWRAKSASG